VIAYRDGHPLALCDVCYRPRRLVQGDRPEIPRVAEPGWEETFPGTFREAAAHSPGNGRGDLGHAVTQPAQPSHRCPECIAADRDARPLARVS
jgi:hypothetical protein